MASSGASNKDNIDGPILENDAKPMAQDVPRAAWNANSASIPDSSGQRPDSLNSPASGSKDAADLLRRLSLVGAERPAISNTDARTAYPALKLSGRIISATICVPYSFRYNENGEWETKPRRGTSALFDSFSYLSSADSSWDHTLVGWTGEINPVQEAHQAGVSSMHATANGIPQPPRRPTSSAISKASAPIPLPDSDKAKAPRLIGDGDPVHIKRIDRKSLEDQLSADPAGKIIPIWLHDSKDDATDTMHLSDQTRWRRYAEHDLYTLFHYKQQEPSNGRGEKRRWADYCWLNQKFAERIAEIYRPGDIIWIHDFHLLLLPSLLRQKISNPYIGFFLHIPFPSSEYLRCLTRRKDILTGVLGSNMIGFQTYSYSRHFASCCTRILGFEAMPAGVDAYGAHIAVDIFPIGIDAAAVAKAAYGNENLEALIQRIRHQYPGQKIIVGRDRLDTVRGVAQKLQGYEKFLESYPEWRGKVVLIQVTSPTSVQEEKEDASYKIANKISELVSRINGRFGGLEYTPVHHFPQYIKRDEYFALLRVADVGLITSVRDGMNTTSLEYVLCQRENHGPLIISEFSGTASSLTQAIHINPWNFVAVAEAINEALQLSPEKKAANHKILYKHVATNNVHEWSRKYLTRLVANLAAFNQSTGTPLLDKSKLLTRYKHAKKRLFMFDYDGTLTPIVQDPQAAIPSDRIIRTIKTLAQDPRNDVWIISGRDQAFLDEWMGHISELGLSAEHGSFVRQPESEEWENLAAKFDMSWQKEVMKVFQHYTERTQGSFIEAKQIALTWHFRRSDPEYGAFQAKEAKKHLEETVATKWDVEVMNGKANLEVRPTFVNKGAIAKRLVDEYTADGGDPPDFVLCLGDDFTDEDMFRALRNTDLPKEHVFSVTVGASSKKTLASWHVLEPADVIATVAMLNDNASTGQSAAE